MRAELVEYGRSTDDGRRISIRDLRALETTGLPIDLTKVETLRDGTFAYEGERVLLYIMHPSGKLPRFHVANCSIWSDMKAKGRQNRYVASRRVDGLFEIEWTSQDGTTSRKMEALSVCQFCLGHIGWKGFSYDRLSSAERKRRVSDFSLAEFFEEKRASLIRERPRWTPETIPSSNYTDDFNEVSSAARRAAGWRCSYCGRLFARIWQRQYLHTHHRNGVKGDNSPENLDVLCLEHHANQPHHEHMKRTSQYARFMALFGPASTRHRP
jgi:hypothetical protein